MNIYLLLFIFTFIVSHSAITLKSKSSSTSSDTPILSAQQLASVALTPAVVNAVNSINKGWTAKLYPQFQAKTRSQLREGYLGYEDPGANQVNALRTNFAAAAGIGAFVETKAIPASFNAIVKWYLLK